MVKVHVEARKRQLKAGSSISENFGKKPPVNVNCPDSRPLGIWDSEFMRNPAFIRNFMVLVGDSLVSMYSKSKYQYWYQC